ncbi:hypothetical protein O6H91_02G094300 [Diphasiastrum complanatum]|uniref:Uncharacterized protein n=1 Tax=Diphasiastrum complanatum TaxID=34168 RepID=A0ACC2EI18_DIPCM|nr:hypothetical protein O6H91_02G094300 [Diphasiastrum complanatum]
MAYIASRTHTITHSPSALLRLRPPSTSTCLQHAPPDSVGLRNCGHGAAQCRAESKVAETALERQTVLQNADDRLQICRVINGMWQTSGGWGSIDRDQAVDAMIRHLDAGFTTFDMADHYGPAEDLYGLLINRIRRERGENVAADLKGLTKWVPPPVKMTRSFVEQNIDQSRKRMDVPTLDMLQFHWWDYSNNGYLDALKHMTDLKEEGKIKTLALTNFDTKRLQVILDSGIPIVSNQVQHSLVDMRPQTLMAELCQVAGVKLITYGTVMGGLLSEKFLDANISIPFVGPSLDTPSLKKYKQMVDAWGGWSLFQELLKTCKRVANKHGVSIPAVAVRYILEQPSVAGSMIGVRLGLSEHLKDSQAIFSLKLDDEDKQAIEAITTKGRDLFAVIGDCGDEYRRV